MPDRRSPSSDEPETVTINDGQVVPAAGGVTLLLFHKDGVAVGQLAPNQKLVVGRAAPSDIVLADPALSRQHASIEDVGGVVWIEDLSSKNGTFVNGMKADRTTIRIDDDVRLGAVGLQLLQGTGDTPDRLPDHEHLLTELERGMVRARLHQHRLALALVRAQDPARAPIGRWFMQVRRAIGGGHLLALYDRATLEILALEIGDSEATEAWASRIIKVGLDVGAPLGCGAALFPDSGTSAEELLGACREALGNADLERPLVWASGTRPESPKKMTASPGYIPPVTASPKTRELYETVARIAPSGLPVLIQGETGTGKELVARALHHAGPRRDGPLCTINCGAIPQQLVESELFGHERGAFTGAEQMRRGLFEEASGGSLLLDEAGELPLQAQASLLRVLESGRFSRVGGAGHEVQVDVRVIAATNRDLEQHCQEGAFRQDLYYRLNAFTLHLPPLRERPEEIRPLTEHFLTEIRVRAGARPAGAPAVRSVSPEAMTLLERYRWPGNVRELRNVIERAVVISRGESITPDHLSDRVQAASRPESDEVDDFRRRIQRYEMELILEALRATDWNQSEAARQLNMPLRTMVRKIQGYGLREMRPPKP